MHDCSIQTYSSCGMLLVDEVVLVQEYLEIIGQRLPVGSKVVLVTH
jgi:hypothetical protein